MNNNQIPNDESNDDLVGFLEYLNETTEHHKSSVAKTIAQEGDKLYREIQKKERSRNKEKEEYVEYILEKSSHYRLNYDKNELMGYSYRDVYEIYQETKKQNRNLFLKIFDFLFKH